jgi:hypothetical protein
MASCISWQQYIAGTRHARPAIYSLKKDLSLVTLKSFGRRHILHIITTVTSSAKYRPTNNPVLV